MQCFSGCLGILAWAAKRNCSVQPSLKSLRSLQWRVRVHSFSSYIKPMFSWSAHKESWSWVVSKLQAVLCTWKPTFFCLLSFEATDSFWNKVVSLQPNQAKRNQLSEESHRQHQTVIVFHVQVIQVLFQCTVQIQFLCTCKLLEILKPLILVEIWLAYWK
jgi:heme O synthase-like polyprenyltransferase